MDLMLFGAGSLLVTLLLAVFWFLERRRANALDARLREAERKAIQAEAVESGIADLKTQLKEATEARAEAERAHASLKATLESAQKHHEERLADLEKARKQLTETFQLTANEVLKASGAELNQKSAENLQTLLNPLREQLSDFQKRVIEDAEKRTGQTSALQTLVSTLHADAARMSEDAKNLANALRAETKMQGDWGELILENILERAGLREGEEFHTQSHEVDAEGRRLRPDVVVSLPGGQRLVIDSKVSLTAFDACVNAETDADREASLKQHLASVRNHVKALGEKDYASLYDGVDFTLMFIPLEGAATLAFQSDNGLTSYAWERNVMIASPTNLMMAMRTVQNLWTIERQNQNAQAIAERAGLLYDKLVGFVEELDKVGKKIGEAHDSWAEAKARLSTGRGNAIRQTEQLKALGARAKKSLPDEYADAASEGEDAAALSAPEERES